MMTKTYLVVYEKGINNWSGYSPQVLGCISAGDTLAEMRAMMTEALEFHLGSMALDGDVIPEAADAVIDFSEETIANGVEYCHVEWLTVRISPEFAGTPVDQVFAFEEQGEEKSEAEIYAGSMRSVFTQTGIKHP